MRYYSENLCSYLFVVICLYFVEQLLIHLRKSELIKVIVNCQKINAVKSKHLTDLTSHVAVGY